MIHATGIACNVCGSEVARLLVEKNGHRVYQCDDCQLAFTHPQPESLEEQYDRSYFDLYRRRRQFRLRRSDARLRQIELMIAPGRLLDIGCSLGYFVEAANARGWQARGTEISPHACEEARKLGLDVVCTGRLEEAHPELDSGGSFDCVTMWDVLEHVPDPTAHMRQVHRILAPGGLVVIGTPNLAHAMFKLKRDRWRHLKPAEHIYYFSEPSVRRLFEAVGFQMSRGPRVFGRRSYPGSLVAAAAGGISRAIQLNDVTTFYGVKV